MRIIERGKLNLNHFKFDGKVPGQRAFMNYFHHTSSTTKTLMVVTLILLAAGILSAQSLYIPRSFRPAFSDGTRTADGRPGPKYWQNKSIHNIKMTVTPPDRTIRGEETIKYTNNSPDALKVLVLRLELNQRRPDAMRDRPIGSDELTEGIKVDDMTINGAVTRFDMSDVPGSTYKIIKLARPLASGSTADLTLKWHYELAKKSDREGAIDETTFYLAYFYPRIAVYDAVNGWDTINFPGSHEFYSEFNDYTVEISVPKNFIVWGTGDLTNAAEVLQPAIAERLKKSFSSDETVNISTVDELAAGKVTAQTPSVTWKWTANTVPDVAFGISDHYAWDGASVVVDKATGRRAAAQSAYNKESTSFTGQVQNIRSALDFGSNDYPGFPYPYSKMTVVRGFADMEYPMMANDSDFQNPAFNRFVAAHEIFHTWFPFLMGINERRFAFMDEGWATAFEYLYNSKDLGVPTADRLFIGFRVMPWVGNDGPDADIPIILPEDSLIGEGYSNNKYGRAALGYLAYRELVGDAAFKKCLKEFISRWQNKHPVPWDMFNAFNDISGKNNDWFFNAWFFTQGYIDLQVANVTGNEIMVKNVGGFPVPFNANVTYSDGSKETLHQTPAFWEKNISQAIIRTAVGKTLTSVDLNGGIFVDFNDKDNNWQAGK